MTSPTILVVGAGPAGCYAAQALRKELPSAQITVIDRLPVPYGLLRYGVAADHQGTKGVQAQFEQMFTRSGVTFIGCVEVGNDVDFDQLLEIFDVVVMATGVSEDRKLGVPGEALDGVIGSGRLTRSLNSHPGETPYLPVVSPKVAIVGSGNVAIDILRLISKTAREWNDSDMDDDILASVLPNPVSEIHLVSRSSADAARWDAAMVRELSGLEAPGFRVATDALGAETSPAGKALQELVSRKPVDGNAIPVTFYFDAAVDEIVGEGKVAGIAISSQHGDRFEVPVNTIITAIGFEWQPMQSRHRVYTSGWLRTGPRGTIPNQRALAKLLASEIFEDLRLGRIDAGRIGRIGLEIEGATDFRGWTEIDRLEKARATGGRPRRKIAELDQMRALAVGRRGENGHEEIAS